MKIVVCVKHVPDDQADRRFTSEGRVDRSQDDGTLNALDENAIETALALVHDSEGHVTVVTMGPPAAEGAVRRGLQMGADAAVLITDTALDGSDVFATARVLAAAVRKIGDDDTVDLVITGMASLDGMTSVVPPLLALELELPAATLAADVTVDGDVVRVRRELEQVSEVLEATMPALISVTDRANKPRYPDFKGIMAARRKPVVVWSLEDLGAAASEVDEPSARTRVLTTAARPARQDRVLITDEGDAGARMAAYLVDNRLV